MSKLSTLEFNGVTIGVNENEMINMTNLWKSSGRGNDKNFNPTHWAVLPGSAKFISTVAKELKCEKSTLLEIQRGRTGGTYGHWQIALAYAKYLSPELHMYVNQVFKERLEEEANPDLALTRGRERAIRNWKNQGKNDEWIKQRIDTIEAQKENSRILANHGDNCFVHSLCADAVNKKVLGKTAKKFKEDNRLPKSANVRDHINTIELLEIQLTNAVSSKHIEDNEIYGNKKCADVHSNAAEKIVNAVKSIG